MTATQRSIDHTTVATVLLVVAVLLAVYRSPLMALVPLVTIGVALWVSLKLLALATLIPGVRLVNLSRIFAVVMLFGAGTDYCLFLISRYREQLLGGETPKAGMASAVRLVGWALAASAGTVVCGLVMMGTAEFGKIRCAGPVIAAEPSRRVGREPDADAGVDARVGPARASGREKRVPSRRKPVAATMARVRPGFWDADRRLRHAPAGPRLRRCR